MRAERPETGRSSRPGPQGLCEGRAAATADGIRGGSTEADLDFAGRQCGVMAVLMPSLRANGSRECAPDDKLREAIHWAIQSWIASSQKLLPMTQISNSIS